VTRWLAAARTTCCLALSLALLSCDDPASPPGGASGRPIVFVARTEVPGGNVGDPGIHSIRSNGSGLRRLTLGAGHAISPAWSRDGERIAFASSPNGGTEIWLMNADGSNAHEASTGFRDCGYDYTHVSWAPSGQRLAAECWNDTWIFDLSTGTGYSLTERLGRGIAAPNWSPIESLLIYMGALTGSFEVDALVVNPDGGAPSRLFASASEPAWSPDGSMVAFTGPVSENGPTAIHVAKRDGSERRAVTVPDPTGWGDEGPTWSPDGRWLAFHRTSRLCANVGTPPREVCIPHWSIHIVRIDGTGLKKLTPDSLQATRPSW
jgi:Tol biopolymer transport system component